MTTMLHTSPDDDEFTFRLQQSQLRYLRTRARLRRPGGELRRRRPRLTLH